MFRSILIVILALLTQACANRYTLAEEVNSGPDFQASLNRNIRTVSPITVIMKNGETHQYRFLVATNQGLNAAPPPFTVGNSSIYPPDETIPYDSIGKVQYQAPTNEPDKAGDKMAGVVGKALYYTVLLPVAILCVPLGCSWM